MKKLCFIWILLVSVVCAEEIVTRHELNGQPYTATAATLPIKGEDGKEKADIFYVAYTLDEAGGNGIRPVTFCFNGGPGSSSVWLHLGGFGPKRIAHAEDGKPTLPVKMEENGEGLLDLTDIVFIDPVSTGLSQIKEGEEGAQFYGVQEDAATIAQFIRLYMTREGCWNRPIYLAGESYGTTRAAVLADFLQREFRIYVDGLILVSPALDFQTLADTHSQNLLPFVLNLPSYTASAWYHGKLDLDLLTRPLESVLQEVEQFAMTDYATALLLGDKMAAHSQEVFLKQLARYTGLSTEYLEKSNFKVPVHRYMKELLRDERRTVGQLDCRYRGIDADLNGEGCEHDPCMDLFDATYAPAINDYLKQHLQWKGDEEYHLLSYQVNRNWNWNANPWSNDPRSGFLDVSSNLAQAMHRDPHMRVLVFAGYYDFTTPYFAADYTMNHLGLDPSLRGNITLKKHHGGHMIYADPANLKAMKEQITKFIQPETTFQAVAG